MTTIIDSDNYTASGIETLFFPGGEPHAKLPKFVGSVLFHLKPRTWNDVGIAACVISALQAQRADFTVFCPYFPGARQDRTDGTAPLTIRIMAELLGGPYPVSVFDPHSSALETFLDFKTFMPADLPIDGMADVAGVIAPDAGAVGRAEQFRAKFSPDAYLISCLKHRDSRTGYISEYEMPDLPARGKYIVVDDICDGGATFNLLAEAWNNDDYAQESELQLFVSHGIFSKGLEAISDTYSRIITTDSWYRLTPNWQNYRFTVYPLLPALFAKIGGNHNV